MYRGIVCIEKLVPLIVIGHSYSFCWDDGQTATVTRNEGSSFRFGAQQHHALLIVGLVVAVSSGAF